MRVFLINKINYSSVGYLYSLPIFSIPVTTRVLYSLSFAKDNHPAMVDGKDGVVELFLELRKNKDKKIRKAAIGGLWNMRVQMIDSKTHVELGMYPLNCS